MKGKMGGRCAVVRQKRNAYRFLVENPGGKKPLGIHRCRREDRTDKDLK